jgi:hypothetical protein
MYLRDTSVVSSAVGPVAQLVQIDGSALSILPHM